MVNSALQIVTGSSEFWFVGFFFFLSIRIKYLCVGSCLPWDFTSPYVYAEVCGWTFTVAGALLAGQPLRQGREFRCVYGGCCRDTQKPVSVVAPNVSAVLRGCPILLMKSVRLCRVVQHSALQQSRLAALPVDPLQESDAAHWLLRHWPAALAAGVRTASGSHKCSGEQLRRML